MINPFKPVRDYDGMRLKLSMTNAIAALFAILVLRAEVAPLDALLKALNVPVKFSGVEIPAGSFIVAVAWAFACYVLRLHNRIAALFSIRSHFDLFVILLPLAHLCGLSVTNNRLQNLRHRADEFMRKTFYKYASSSRPQIDSHLITSALDHWTNFWIFAEIIPLALITAGILFFHQKAKICVGVLMLIFILLFILNFLYQECVKAALVELEAIASDANRKRDILEKFSELQD